MRTREQVAGCGRERGPDAEDARERPSSPVTAPVGRRNRACGSSIFESRKNCTSATELFPYMECVPEDDSTPSGEFSCCDQGSREGRSQDRGDSSHSDQHGDTGTEGTRSGLESAPMLMSCPRICIDSRSGGQLVVTAEDDQMLCSGDQPVIRLRLRKPRNWKWQLTTSRSSPAIMLPAIQLLDDLGGVLLDTGGETRSTGLRTSRTATELSRPPCADVGMSAQARVKRNASERISTRSSSRYQDGSERRGSGQRVSMIPQADATCSSQGRVKRSLSERPHNSEGKRGTRISPLSSNSVSEKGSRRSEKFHTREMSKAESKKGNRVGVIDEALATENSSLPNIIRTEDVPQSPVADVSRTLQRELKRRLTAPSSGQATAYPSHSKAVDLPPVTQSKSGSIIPQRTKSYSPQVRDQERSSGISPAAVPVRNDSRTGRSAPELSREVRQTPKSRVPQKTGVCQSTHPRGKRTTTESYRTTAPERSPAKPQGQQSKIPLGNIHRTGSYSTGDTENCRTSRNKPKTDSRFGGRKIDKELPSVPRSFTYKGTSKPLQATKSCTEKSRVDGRYHTPVDRLENRMLPEKITTFIPKTGHQIGGTTALGNCYIGGGGPSRTDAHHSVNNAESRHSLYEPTAPEMSSSQDKLMGLGRGDFTVQSQCTGGCEDIISKIEVSLDARYCLQQPTDGRTTVREPTEDIGYQGDGSVPETPESKRDGESGTTVHVSERCSNGTVGNWKTNIVMQVTGDDVLEPGASDDEIRVRTDTVEESPQRHTCSLKPKFTAQARKDEEGATSADRRRQRKEDGRDTRTSVPVGKWRAYRRPRSPQQPAGESTSSPSTPTEDFQKKPRNRNKISGDRLLQINGRSLSTFEQAAELLNGGPDVVQLLVAHRRHDGSSPASPRRSKRRGVSAAAMGSNVSRHSGKGLSGRRTQSSGNLCNGNKILAPSVGRVLDTCGVGAKDRNKFCGSLPNHLDVNSDGTTPPPPPPPTAPACNNTLKNQRNVELRLHALDATTLHDQGYGSERSPEEEHPPRLKGWVQYPFITQESTFDVCLLKGSRGLGLSVTGGIDTPEQWPGLVRIKRLFPHQPAWQSGLLAQGDILLAANCVPLVGLTNYQALEVLRKTPSNVVLTVCRPPLEFCCLLPPSDPPPPPPPPPRRDPAYSLLPLPPLQSEGPLGEFDIMLTKVNRSLGFTLRKEDDSALGHYVRALVREPALSDGRVRPGDKIVAVNDVDISPMSHEEAVMFLRQCGDVVKLRLYRDAAQTPVSALSPTEEAKVFRPKPPLRKEAMDMLSDLAGRKLLPSESGDSSSSSYSKLRRVSDGQSSSTCSSPRRRRLAKTPSPDIAASAQDRLVQKYLVSGQMGTSDSSEERSSLDSTRARGHGSSFASTADSFEGEMRPTRPNFLDLCGGIGTPSSSRKHKFTFTVASTEGEGNGEDWDSLAPTGDSEELATSTTAGSASQFYSNSSEECGEGPLPTEPASMPPLTNLSSTSSTSTAFSYRNPAYQSAHPPHPTHPQGMKKSSEERASDQDIPGKVFTCQPGTGTAEGSRGLLKWKGVVFTPEAETEEGSGNITSGTDDSNSQVVAEKEHRDQVFMVELTRGWNSRLGFSLQGDGNLTYISAIYADSVAAKDGRLLAGDQVLMVNDESVEEMSTADVIDLLRKIRGTIGITVLRKSGPNLQAS